ncbi:squalene synthase HpnC [Bordetella bronchialis]|uniref:Squalene synthase HpnC n=1 Tax=Bordetella bronchialis TaxID=463025 RepID=A0A193FZ27_9BORD|nr:squalene synthase HpnC [Bordetella bronchialis]ANN72880.1 squalene synthase HpnC [Bordetella bronchialis]
MAVDHYENFPVASILLPPRLRAAVRDIYRFARSADDIADEGEAADAERLAGLAAYRAELHRIAQGKPGVRAVADPALAAVFDPLAATIARHQLPVTPFYDLLSAFEQDVTVKRYADEAALLDYCARSANPVGRLMLHLYGAAGADNLRDADAICTGLQLVNFWQDVHIDWRKDRVYLPQDALRRHGVTEQDIGTCRLSPAWSALMADMTARTRALLNSGAPLARRLPGRIGLELRLVVQGGLRILERIERARYDVFMNRPQLGARDWGVMMWRAFS